MAKDIHQEFLEECAAKGRALGLIVRCESHGVLAMVHPKHATEAEKQPALPLPTEARLYGCGPTCVSRSEVQHV